LVYNGYYGSKEMGQNKLLVVKEFTFDAAHILPGYDGPCGSLHGHTYRLQVGIQGEIDSVTGMVIDFKDIKNQIRARIVDPLDHSYLNEPVNGDIYVPGFPKHMPTAENMVLWIRDRLIQLGMDVGFVQLWETPTSFCAWRSS